MERVILRHVDDIIKFVKSKNSYYILRNSDDITNGISIESTPNLIKIRPHIPTSSSYYTAHDELPRLDNFQYYCIFEIFKEIGNTRRYIIDQSDEGYSLEHLIKDIHFLQSKFKINTDNIMFMGSDFYGNLSMNKYNIMFGTPIYKYIPKWNLVNHSGIHLISKADISFTDGKIKKYKSTCLLARSDNYRFEFVKNLFDIRYYSSNSIFSTFPNRKSIDINNEVIEFYKYFINNNNYPEKYSSHEFFKTTKFGEHIGEPIPVDDLQTRHVPFNNDSYLWITSESLVDVDDVMFITEKILKSYMWYKPMIVFAVPHTLSILNKLGFIDVFELMGFDSSYDSILNYKDRLSFIMNQIKIFIDTPIDKIHELYNSEDVQSALIHNNLLFKKLLGDEIELNGLSSYSNYIEKLTSNYLKEVYDTPTLNTDALSFYTKILNN